MVQRCCASYVIGASKVLILACSWARPAIIVEWECFYCPPPFQRKAEGHCFWFSVVRGSEFLVGTLSP